MINDIIIGLINLSNYIYSAFHLDDIIDDIIQAAYNFQTYIPQIQYYISGAYFIFGKPMIITLLSLTASFFLVSLIGAVVNIVSQFIP